MFCDVLANYRDLDLDFHINNLIRQRETPNPNYRIQNLFPGLSGLTALKTIFGQLPIECHGIAAVKTGFTEIVLRAFDFGGV